MIEVTDETLAKAGVREWMDHCQGLNLADSLLRCYHAMRSLEPKPKPTPDMVHAICEALAKDGHDVDYSLAEDAIKAMHGVEKKPADHFGLSPRGIEPNVFHHDELMADIIQAGREERRLDALTALVLELARRDPGYAPGDAKLNQLIAALNLAHQDT